MGGLGGPRSFLKRAIDAKLPPNNLSRVAVIKNQSSVSRKALREVQSTFFNLA